MVVNLLFSPPLSGGGGVCVLSLTFLVCGIFIRIVIYTSLRLLMS